MKTKFPVVSKELITELEKLYPDKVPDFEVSPDRIRFIQGQIQVVRFLRGQFDLQSQSILEKY
jgi:hypothetical protein